MPSQSFLPFVLGKIDRVSFGLLTPADLARALSVDAKMPKSRRCVIRYLRIRALQDQ